MVTSAKASIRLWSMSTHRLTPSSCPIVASASSTDLITFTGCSQRHADLIIRYLFNGIDWRRSSGNQPVTPDDLGRHVTSLTVEAASFFSCRVGMMGQSGPQDVACGVFVCRGAMRASLAGEFRLCDAVLACCVPTGFAAVGGVPGVDLNPSPPSLFRFGAQYRDELTPASVTDRSVEPRLRPGSVGQEHAGIVGVRDGLGPAQHVRDLHVLHDDQVVSGGELTSLLVMKVLALVGDLTMARRDGCPFGRAIPPTTAGPLQSLLGCRQPSRGGARPPRIVDALPVAGGGKGNDADVDTGLTAGHRQRIGRNVIAGQHQHPAPPLSLDLDRLHPASHLAVQINLDLADALQIHPPPLGQPAGAITVFGPLHTVEPGLALKTRIPRLYTGFRCLHPAEESDERLVQPPQRRLLTGERPHSLIGAHRWHLRQLRRLIPIADPRLTGVRPRIPTLLQRRVVKLAVSVHTLRQRHMLAGGGPQPKHVRPPHNRSTPLRAERRLDMTSPYATTPTNPARPRCSPAPIHPTAKTTGPLGTH